MVSMQYPCAFGYERGRKVREPTNEKNSFIHIPASNLRDLLNIPLIIVERKWNFFVVMALIVFFAEKYLFQRIVSEIHLYLKFRERRKKNTCTSEWEIS